MANAADRIAAYRARFCYVDDTYCVQQPVWADRGGEQHGGHYLRAYADQGTKEHPLPLTDTLIAAHLRGEVTLAFYTARRLSEGRTLCREGIMECDDKRTIPDPAQPGRMRTVPENGLTLMRAAHGRLERAGIPSILELSRRGARVRLFAAEAVPARTMQNLLLFALGAEERVRMAQGERAVEINPKQDILAPGRVGNSVRGPFGVHLRSGERYPFIYPDGRPMGYTLAAQLDAVLAVPTVDVASEVARWPWLEQERLGTVERPVPDQERVRPVPEREERHSGRSPIARWKEQHSLVEVLSRYGVDVQQSGSYHCPLPHHGPAGDRSPSLSVDVERGLWHCHTASVGGDALTFVQLIEGLATPGEALAFVRGRGELELIHGGEEWGGRG